MTTLRAIIFRTLPIALFAAAPVASADVFDGSVKVDAQIEGEQADVIIEGQAAYAIFWVTAFRMRLEDLADDIRRARGRDVTCYAYGPRTATIEEWVYSCRLLVGELGEISAPPIPASVP